MDQIQFLQEHPATRWIVARWEFAILGEIQRSPNQDPNEIRKLFTLVDYPPSVNHSNLKFRVFKQYTHLPPQDAFEKMRDYRYEYRDTAIGETAIWTGALDTRPIDELVAFAQNYAASPNSDPAIVFEIEMVEERRFIKETNIKLSSQGFEGDELSRKTKATLIEWLTTKGDARSLNRAEVMRRSLEAPPFPFQPVILPENYKDRLREKLECVCTFTRYSGVVAFGIGFTSTFAFLSPDLTIARLLLNSVYGLGGGVGLVGLTSSARDRAAHWYWNYYHKEV